MIFTSKRLQQLWTDSIKFVPEEVRQFDIYTSFSISMFERKFSVAFDRYSREVIIRVPRFSPPGKTHVLHWLAYIRLKMYSYRHFCPIDPSNALDMVLAASKVVNPEQGFFIAALLIEILTDYFVLHMNPEIFDNAIRLARSLGKDKELSFILDHLYNIMAGKNLFRVRRKYREKALKIFNLIFGSNFTEPSSWPRITVRFAEEIKDFVQTEDTGELWQEIYYAENNFIPALITYGVPVSPTSVGLAEQIYHAFTGSPQYIPSLLTAFLPFRTKDVLRVWYRIRAKELVKVYIEHSIRKITTGIHHPSTWDASDPIERLDTVLSASISPLMIPGYTTKKWVRSKSTPQIKRGRLPDILIVLDSSESMGRKPGEYPLHYFTFRRKKKYAYSVGSKYDIALVTAFGILDYAISLSSRIAVINFSGRAYIRGFTRDRIALENTLLIFQNDGTVFPIRHINRVLSGKKNVLILIFSDAAVYNEMETASFLENLARHHDLYFFHIEKGERGLHIIESVRHGGGHIIRISNLAELPRTVFTLTTRHLYIS